MMLSRAPYRWTLACYGCFKGSTVRWLVSDIQQSIYIDCVESWMLSDQPFTCESVEFWFHVPGQCLKQLTLNARQHNESCKAGIKIWIRRFIMQIESVYILKSPAGHRHRCTLCQNHWTIKMTATHLVTILLPDAKLTWWWFRTGDFLTQALTSPTFPLSPWSASASSPCLPLWLGALTLLTQQSHVSLAT